MTTTIELRREHAQIIKQASLLTGLATGRMTRETAGQARAAILAIDARLVSHLEREDAWLYPALAAADDREVRRFAEECIEELGGVLGAWNAYRDRWDVADILSDPVRFHAATRGIIGALAIRVEMENRNLYPLMDALVADASGQTATS